MIAAIIWRIHVPEVFDRILSHDALDELTARLPIYEVRILYEGLSCDAVSTIGIIPAAMFGLANRAATVAGVSNYTRGRMWVAAQDYRIGSRDAIRAAVLSHWRQRLDRLPENTPTIPASEVQCMFSHDEVL